MTIGDELLLGFTIDTNAAHLARALAAIGVHIARRTTVGDAASEIAAAVGAALDRTGAVITTGGLGPTSDDLTKQSIAELFGRTLAVDEAHLAWMEDRWIKRFNRPLPAANRQQAMIPDGAPQVRESSWLGAGHLARGRTRPLGGDAARRSTRDARHARRHAVAVARDAHHRGHASCDRRRCARPVSPNRSSPTRSIPWTAVRSARRWRISRRSPASISASRFATFPAITPTALLSADAARLRERLGTWIYGEGDADLAAVALDLCRARGFTIAVAESCSGGLLGGRLTAIPGSSDVFLGGVIAYDNAVKQELLGVSEESLREAVRSAKRSFVRWRPVSRRSTHAAVGLAITGVAGPGGGTPEKPVGTVWICVDIQGEVHAQLLRLWGDRDEVRQRSAQWTLDLLRRRLQSADRPAESLVSAKSAGL